MRAIFLAPLLPLAACNGGTGPDPATLSEPAFERELARRFQYGPPQPAPLEAEDAAEGRARDAAYFAAYPDFDRSYSPEARRQARRLAARLRDEAAALSHEQFVLRVAEIAALADNAHSAVDENAFRKNTPRLPVRGLTFSDGLHILWATPAHADLLGARIDTIDGRGIEDIYRAIRRFHGGTEARRRAVLTPMLESPALLHAAGMADGRDALTLSGVLADGRPFERRIQAEQRGRSAWVSSTPRTLYPLRSGEPMVSFLRRDEDLPAYLRNPTRLFTTEALPGGGLYIGLAFNNDADEGPIGPFLADVLARIRSERPSFVVLDMRMNGGGDYTKTYDFATRLPEAAGSAPVYALTSVWTFSAAITTVAALKQAGGSRVTIVGTPVGDRLDFWAEGGTFDLPNEFIRVHYAAGRHRYDGSCDDMDQCFWLNRRYPVRVPHLRPDIFAPLSFADYRARRDPAIDAVLARESARRAESP